MNFLNRIIGGYNIKHHSLQKFSGTELEVDKWMISDFILRKIIPIVGVRPYPLSELELLVSTLIWYQPTHICDWGTHLGKATRVFYETIKAFNLKIHLISIDLPEGVKHVEHPHEKRGKLVRHLPEVELLLGDGVTTSINFLKKQKKMNIRPMFFLDGDHSYKSVKRELGIIGKTYPKAAIIVHDTFYQSPDSKYNVGPHCAIVEYIAKHRQYKLIQTNFGLPGMTVLLSMYEK